MADTPLQAAYEPKPTLQNAGIAGAKAGGVGLLVSAIQNALDTHNRGAAGVVTRTGGTIGFFAGMGASFALGESLAANVREKDDAVNGAVGGCAAGFLAGLRARSIPMAVMSCAVLGGAMATFDVAGGSLTGDGRDVEGKETKERRRAQFFKQKPEPAEAVASS